MIVLLLACGGDLHDSGVSSVVEAVSAAAGDDQVVVVGSPVQLDGSESTGASFVWDFGDGETDASVMTTHTYDEPGRYTAILTATGTDGSWRSDSALVTVYLPPTTVEPVWSSTLVEVSGSLWVANPEAGSVGIVDVGTQALQEKSACENPRTVAFDGEHVAVACEDSDEMVLFDLTGEIVERVALPDGGRPFGVVGRGGVWWVTLQGRASVVRWDGSDLEEIEVGLDPRGIALLADGRVVVTRWRSPETGGELSVIADGVVTAWSLALDERGDSDTTTGGVINLLEQVVPSPDGGTVYVPGMHANILRGEWRSGEDLDHQTTTRAVFSWVDATSGAESVDTRKQFDERGRSIAVAWSALGDRLFVLHPGVGSVTVLDAWTGQISGTILDVGTFPTGLLVSGETLYVNAWLDRTIRAYDISDLSSSPDPMWSAETQTQEPLSETVLLGKKIFYDASDLRMTKSGYISCASCHPDGRDDGVTWDFTGRGEGLRNTISLEGRSGMGMGPLHWSGNFDEVQDFEGDIRNSFSGSGFLTDEDWEETQDPLGTPKAGRSASLDALAEFVASLSQVPISPGISDSVGEARFAQAGCVGCHPAPLYTDSSVDAPTLHDIGTLTAASGQRLGDVLEGLDTPTLLGAHATGPWLHDGSAETLYEAIFAHDSAAVLDEETVADLAEFVNSL